MASLTAVLSPPAISCNGLALGYGQARTLDDVGFTVAPGETLALLGSSGSGKTTLLNAIAGFVRPLAGEIWLAGELVSAPGRCVPPERRRIGMVFQDYALWPHLPVLDTVAYPLRRAGAPKAAARERARALLRQLDLTALADRRPGQLSGGEQQRAGLARALACDPAVYLFDEPTAHLDAMLRAQVLEEVARRRADSGAAAVYATHDAAEALAIADRVAVLHSGGIAQVGAPADVYAEPADLTVAMLTGPVSVLDARALDASVLDAASLSEAPGVRGAKDAALLVRPDWAGIDGAGDLPGEIGEIRFRGPHTDYHVVTQAGTVLIREPGYPRRARGPVRWSLRQARLLPPG